MDFIESQGRPQTVAEQLRQHRFVQKHIDKYERERSRTPADLKTAPNRRIRQVYNTPFVTDALPTPYNIMQKHVLAALDRTEDYGREASLVLYLTRLYGPNGEHFEDPRVASMATTEYRSGQELTGLELHTYIRLMAEIDTKWLDDHPESIEPVRGAKRIGAKNNKPKEL
jgi:hypothetical protein